MDTHVDDLKILSDSLEGRKELAKFRYIFIRIVKTSHAYLDKYSNLEKII